MSYTKTHKSSLCIIPPVDFWPSIQQIRQTHDRHLKRWPQPHINLLYPFIPIQEFRQFDVFEKIKETLADEKAFKVKLQKLEYFVHGRKSSTVWLKPDVEEGEGIVELQQRLLFG